MLPRIVFAVIAMSALAAQAAVPEFHLVVQDHKFHPTEIQVPVGQKFKLIVENKDASPEEFESAELNREKVVVGNGTIDIYLGPLEPGKYGFFGDFHQDTAQGAVIAK